MEAADMDELLFTSASVLDLLSNIDELKGKDINLAETSSGVTITVGDVTYEIKSSDASEVEVDESIIEEIDSITTDAYEELSTDGVQVDDKEDVQGGPIKSLLKTLLLGGMIKLTAKMLRE